MEYTVNTQNGNFTFNKLNNGKLWNNYFWNKFGYVCEMTNTGLMTTHRVDENSETIRLNQKQQSCVYLRDDETRKIWNIGVAPVCEPVTEYECTQGQEFSTISSVCDGIYGELSVGVCPDDTAEVWRVRVCNRSDRARKISVVPFAPLDQEGFNNHGLYFACTTAETHILKDINTVVSHSDHPHKPHSRCDIYLSAYEPTRSMQGRLEAFYGLVGNNARPLELMQNDTLSNEEAGVRDKCVAVQNSVELAAGEEKTFFYRLGFADSIEEIRATYSERKTESEHFFDNIIERGMERYGKLRAETPDKNVNRIMNFWAEKQVDYCMIGKKAVRDNAQLALAMLNYDTELAKKTLTECLEHQFSSGKALLNWIYVETVTYSDPPLWLILATCEYVKESGDFSYLRKTLKYYDGGEATVLEHLKAAVRWYMSPENIGPNGLPKILHADWNDALNIHDDNAESIFIAMGLCWALGEYIELCKKRYGLAGLEEVIEFRNTLAKTVNEKAWNGTHYVRAFSKFGVVGDKPPVYINPQSWAILAGIVPEDRLDTLLDSIDKYETPEGIRLCSPAYETYDEAVGRMSGMRPGAYENGGIYNHACGFKVMADCKIGRGNEALRTLLAMIPDSSKHNSVEVTTTEPYVFTNCYLKNRTENMMVGFSWQTGSSAWGLRSFYEGIAGICREYDGLRFAPAMPDAWKTMRVTRIYQGNELNIYYHNGGSRAVRLEVDGVELNGNLVTPFEDSAAHRIDVYC